MENTHQTHRAIVRGRVQGVFFRVSVKERADELGVVGTAQNLADGSVEVVFVSPNDDAHQLFVEFLHEGPPSAQVESVNIERADEQAFEGFSIQ